MLKADHFAFEISDMDEAIRFYRETLGLKLLFRELDEIHHEVYAFLELDGGNLELVQLLDENNKPISFIRNKIRQPYCPHIAIKTENMEQLVLRLKEKKVPIVKGPLEIPEKVKWIYVNDPDDNVIEFIQWL